MAMVKTVARGRPCSAGDLCLHACSAAASRSSVAAVLTRTLHPPSPPPRPAMASTTHLAAHQVSRRASTITRHLHPSPPAAATPLEPSPCVYYCPPELSSKAGFDVRELRWVMDGHDVEARDWAFRVMEETPLFRSRRRSFMIPDYNEPMEQQREATWRRIQYLLDRGLFEGWLTGEGREAEMRRFAVFEVLSTFDHSWASRSASISSSGDKSHQVPHRRRIASLPFYN